MIFILWFMSLSVACFSYVFIWLFSEQLLLSISYWINSFSISFCDKWQITYMLKFINCLPTTTPLINLLLHHPLLAAQHSRRRRRRRRGPEGVRPHQTVLPLQRRRAGRWLHLWAQVVGLRTRSETSVLSVITISIDSFSRPGAVMITVWLKQV